MEYTIVKLRDNPTIKETAAEWFHAKWGIPLQAYAESMEQCIQGRDFVPQWYVAVQDGDIIGGVGVIENDFHDRKDLTPNVCAVYVEEQHRGNGIAGEILAYICNDFYRHGIDTLYLLTDHKDFYEKYGWQFLCMAQGDGEDYPSRIYIHKM